jgi:hypothetical protein
VCVGKKEIAADTAELLRRSVTLLTALAVAIPWGFEPPFRNPN